MCGSGLQASRLSDRTALKQKLGREVFMMSMKVREAYKHHPACSAQSAVSHRHLLASVRTCCASPCSLGVWQSHSHCWFLFARARLLKHSGWHTRESIVTSSQRPEKKAAYRLAAILRLGFEAMPV
jgi:hypothetical protein